MVSYDSTTITIYLAMVLTVAALGIGVVLATLGYAVACHRRARLQQRESVCRYYGRLAFHH
ncbi:MAG TPA: hypothetical protein VFM08_01395 [Nocardioides sp.]|jgi:hypothetical protein|nr:hypothetical protein [Nocardioides sp.]